MDNKYLQSARGDLEAKERREANMLFPEHWAMDLGEQTFSFKFLLTNYVTQHIGEHPFPSLGFLEYGMESVSFAV